MIWAIVSKNEMKNFGTDHVFKYYQEALGSGNIHLAVVREDDPLNFVGKDDIVLLRTASSLLIHTIAMKGVKTTAEYSQTYQLTNDKVSMSQFLSKMEIAVPRQYGRDEVVDGKTYFVKPRFGSDSKTISEKSICHSAEDVRKRVRLLYNQGVVPVIEDFIKGKELTATAIKKDGTIRVYPIGVDCSRTDGIQTFEGKSAYSESGERLSPFQSKRLFTLTRMVFEAIGIKHHARIDYRQDEQGNLYVIDVNLLPGLGPIGDLARCMLLSSNYSYIDALNSVIYSATKL